jgi:NADH:ubiquinone oxidoreductase subunit 3 (subunit A)
MEFRLFVYFFFFNFFIAFLLFLLSRVVSLKLDDIQKTSAYECGFEPFQDGQISFNIHYFLVAILFIIFDVEIVLLFPLVINFSLHSLFSFFFIYFFLFMLTLGFLLE